MLSTVLIIVSRLVIVGFILIDLWYFLLYLPIILASLLMDIFFWYHSSTFVDFVLWSTDKSLSNNRLSFIIIWIHFNVIGMQPWLYWSTLKVTTLIYPYFVGLQTRFIQDLLEWRNDYKIQQDNPSIFLVNINNRQQMWLPFHICLLAACLQDQHPKCYLDKMSILWVSEIFWWLDWAIHWLIVDPQK